MSYFCERARYVWWSSCLIWWRFPIMGKENGPGGRFQNLLVLNKKFTDKRRMMNGKEK